MGEFPFPLNGLSDVRSFDVPAQMGMGSFIYFLMREGETVYIGQTINLMARLGQHARVIKFDRAYFVPVDPEWRLQIEGDLIRWLGPIENDPRRKDGTVPSAIFLRALGLSDEFVRDCYAKAGTALPPTYLKVIESGLDGGLA